MKELIIVKDSEQIICAEAHRYLREVEVHGKIPVHLGVQWYFQFQTKARYIRTPKITAIVRDS